MNDFFVRSHIDLTYSEVLESNKNLIEHDYMLLSNNEETLVDSWVKEKSGVKSDAEKAILNLLVELHRKVDNIEKILSNSGKKLLDLDHKCIIRHINYDRCFIVDDMSNFKSETKYYGRVCLDIYPSYNFGFYFHLLGNSLSISKIEIRDIDTWNAFTAQNERFMLRENKK